MNYMTEFTDLYKNYMIYQDEYDEAILRAVHSGWYILGNETESFEREFADYLGVRNVIGVNSGTDALILAVRALGIGEGDEVIVPAGTYIASVLSITENGATPVYIDSDPNTLLMNTDLIEAAITEKTKAILPVHLYGQSCDMERIMSLAKKHDLFVLEDCAQSHGSEWRGRLTGTWGTLAAFSFYPTKPLGAFGDAGVVATDDDALADKLRLLRNYGSRIKYHNESIGRNSRLDEIQAAVLRVGLYHLGDTNKMRIRIAEKYLDRIKNEKIRLPFTDSSATNMYHLFPVLVEDQGEFQKYMEQNKIKTQIHYPIPPYVADCYRDQGYDWDDFPEASFISRHEVSLPIYSGMCDGDVERVIEVVNEY